MAIGKINGPMLQPNLERQGVDIALDANLTYWDVNNRYVGIKTSTPNYPLDVRGNVHLSNIYIRGNTIAAESGYKLNLGDVSNITIAGGEANSIMYTDGLGNVQFGSISTLVQLEGFSGNGIELGSTTTGSFDYAVALTGQTTITDAIVLINQNLGNVTTNVNALTAEVYSNANAASYLTVYGGNISANNVTANLFSGNVSGNISGEFAAFTDISGLITTAEQTNITKLGTLSDLSVDANITASNISALSAFYGDLHGDVFGNLTGSVTGNIVGNTATFDSLTGNILTANQPFITSVGSLANLTVIGNIQSGNVSATSFTGHFLGNIEGTTASFSNITGSILTPSQPLITTVGTLTGLTVSGDTTVGNVTSSTNFYGNVVADTITPYKTNVVEFTNQTAVKLPSGDNTTRPSGVAGYFRYNTAIATIEYYNGADWIPFNNQITDQQISPDGNTNNFTLNQHSTAAGLMVSINGTMQTPGVAYTVSGTTITFAEVPQVTDLVDVRFIASAGTTTVDYAIVDVANVTVNTSNVIVDSFSPSLYRGAKYVVSSSNGSDASMLEALLIQNNGTAAITTSANINTGSSVITFYANVYNGLVNFIAIGSASSNKLKIQRTYFDI